MNFKNSYYIGMGEKSKKSLILSLLALALMLGVFVYLLLDLRKPGNEYVRDVKEVEQATKEAEVTLFLGEAKSLVKKPFITIQRAPFEWIDASGSIKNINGWSLALTEVNVSLVTDLYTFFEENGFSKNDTNSFITTYSETRGYVRGDLLCITTLMNVSELNVFCGYIN